MGKEVLRVWGEGLEDLGSGLRAWRVWRGLLGGDL